MAMHGCSISIYKAWQVVEVISPVEAKCTREAQLDIDSLTESMQDFVEKNKDASGDCTLSFAYKNWLEGEALANALANPSSLKAKAACRKAVLAVHGVAKVAGGRKAGSKEGQF